MLELVSVALSAGLFVAVPFTGRRLLGGYLASLPAIAHFSVWVCAGLCVWSVPLLGSAALGLYHPELVGTAGWLSVIVLATARIPHGRRRPLDTADAIVLTALLLVAGLVAAFPADPFTTGRDMGTYANHALYMAQHGRLDVPYPKTELPNGFTEYSGIYPTQPTMTVQFSAVYPAWLAQTYSVFGVEGLLRFNAVVGLLALVLIYGFGRQLMGAPLAGIVVLFLALNPAQIWTSRQTLSEPLTQLLVWGALLLLSAYLARGRPMIGLWAGALLGMAAWVRIDGFLLLPLLLGAHGLWLVLGRRLPSSSRKWLPVYGGAAAIGSSAAVYYLALSRPYIVEHATQLLMIVGLTLLAAVVLALLHVPGLTRRLSATLTQPPAVLLVVATLFALAAYAYFVRPVSEPFATFDVPGQAVHGERSYVEEALPQIGLYLSLPVVWGGLAGWALLFGRSSLRRRGTHLLPLLSIGLGFAALYFWNQSAYPDHFWAVRRFVPVIIPAIVLLAGVAAYRGVRRLSPPGRRLAVGLTAPLILGYVVWMGAPFYTVAERAGAYAALQDFAAQLPADRPILGLTESNEATAIWTALYMAFDRPIVPVDVSSQAMRDALRIELEAAGPGGEPLLTYVGATLPSGFTGRETSRVPISLVYLHPTFRGIPMTTVRQDGELVAVQVSDAGSEGP